jgi:hypothetical protein
MSSENQMSADQLRELAARIVENPDCVDELTEEQVTAVRKHTNPYGSNFSAKKSWANITITNFRDEYFKRMYLYGVIAFIHRLATEAVPTDQHAMITAECKKMCAEYAAGRDAGNLTNAECAERIKFAEQRRDQKIESATRLYRSCITKFLASQFEYDPDRHVRAAKTTNAADPERRPNPREWAEGQAARGVQIAAKMRADPDKMYKYMHDNILAGYQISSECTSMLKSVLPHLPEDSQGVALNLYARSKGLTNDMRKIAEPCQAAETLSAYTVSPPADVFHNFGRYMSNNFEAMQGLVRDFSGLRPDFEFAVIYHQAFKTPEAAREHRLAHESEFRSPVLTVENNGISLLGPYKENSERIDFYNKNTEILKNMMDQNAADSKLGQDIMTKTVTKKKKDNIDECGPDAEGLSNFTKSGTLTEDSKLNMTKLGAFKGMTREEQDAYVEAQKAQKAQKAQVPVDECPDDALECSIYFTQTDADGNQRLQETKFYTQAEAPLHGQDGSDYVDSYQPRQTDPLALTTKKIVGRDGKTKTIKVPVKGGK